MNKKREGFTLTELAVCIFIICLAMALLGPALFSAKRSALDLECKNNLRQLGLGFSSYYNSNNRFPENLCGGNANGNLECFSAFVRLLPHIDQANLFQEVDFSDTSLDVNTRTIDVSEKNQKNLQQGPKIYLCPSDPNAKPGSLNYRMNFPLHPQGDNTRALPSTLQRVSDGASNTALCSERFVGQAGSLSTGAIPLDWPANLGPACIEAQLKPDPTRDFDYHCGHTWLKATNRHSAYTHYFPPNGSVGDCLFGTVGKGLLNARSGHNQGVNVLCFDGHVSF